MNDRKSRRGCETAFLKIPKLLARDLREKLATVSCKLLS